MKNLIKANVITLVIICISALAFAGSVKQAVDNTIDVLEKERLLANEQHALDNIHTLYIAVEAYRGERKAYPKSLIELVNSEPPYLNSSWVDKKTRAEGYKYEIIESSDTSCLIVAYPDASLPQKYSGRYSYCVMEDGAIRIGQDSKRIDNRDEAKKLSEIDAEKEK